MTSRRNLWLAIAGVAVVQTLALCWMIWDRAQLLASGREIVLEVVPVDPRSLFRGDYVILSYEISNIALPDGLERVHRGEIVYVTLQKTDAGVWQVVKSSTARPSPTGPDQVVLKGRVRYASSPARGTTGQARVRYGIESYFVPEGKGRELETLVREKKLSALVAVDEEGNAGIKGLIVDGERVYEEPLL